MDYALVSFTEGGKQSKYLVKTDTIQDFDPASPTDFDPKRKYRIKWQKSFCGADGDSHDGCYLGNVLLLGASPKEVKYKAKEKGIRLPSNFPVIEDLPAAPAMKRPLRKTRRARDSGDEKEFVAKMKRMEKTSAALSCDEGRKPSATHDCDAKEKICQESAKTKDVSSKLSPSAAQTLFNNCSQRSRILMSTTRLKSDNMESVPLPHKLPLPKMSHIGKDAEPAAWLSDDKGPPAPVSKAPPQSGSVIRNLFHDDSNDCYSEKSLKDLVKDSSEMHERNKDEVGASSYIDSGDKCDFTFELFHRSQNSSVSKGSLLPRNTQVKEAQKETGNDLTKEKQVLRTKQESDLLSSEKKISLTAKPEMVKYYNSSFDTEEGNQNYESSKDSTSLETGEPDLAEQLDTLKKVHHKCYFKLEAAERDKNKANAAVEKLKKRLTETEVTVQKMKHELQESQSTNRKLREEIQELKHLNLEIQKQLFSRSMPGRRADSHAGDVSQRWSHSSVAHGQPPVDDNEANNSDEDCNDHSTGNPVADVSSPNREEKNHSGNNDSDIESEEEKVIDRIYNDLKHKKQLKGSDHKVYIGSGISINRTLWEQKLRLAQQDSIFFKDAAQGIWGIEGLKTRTADKASLNKTIATPAKVKVLTAMLKGKLKARGATSQETELVIGKTKRWLGEKMYDATRKDKRAKKGKEEGDEKKQKT